MGDLSFEKCSEPLGALVLSVGAMAAGAALTTIAPQTGAAVIGFGLEKARDAGFDTAKILASPSLAKAFKDNQQTSKDFEENVRALSKIWINSFKEEYSEPNTSENEFAPSDYELANQVAEALAISLPKIEFPHEDFRRITENAGKDDNLYLSLANGMIGDINDAFGAIKSERGRKIALDILAEACRLGITQNSQIAFQTIIDIQNEMYRDVRETKKTVYTIDAKVDKVLENQELLMLAQSTQMGAPIEAAKQYIKSLRDNHIPPEDWPNWVVSFVNNANELMITGTNHGKVYENALQKSKELFDNGKTDEAIKILENARTANNGKRQELIAEDISFLEREISLHKIAFEFDLAALKYAKIAALKGKTTNIEIGVFLGNQAIELSAFGQRMADNSASSTAVAINKLLISDYFTFEFDKMNWAGIQNNLGNALSKIGARQSGEGAIASFNYAKAAYENALIVRTQRDMPADWAATQNNLGAVLSKIGARQSGEEAIASFNAAIVAYENALIVYTQKDMPADWAMTQNNLGNVLADIGVRQSGEEAIISFNAAKSAYENALKVYTQKDTPADWAMTQNNLGNVLWNIGARQSGEEAIVSFNAAKAAYENALIVYTQKDMPADWAMAQNNLGIVLQDIGARQSGEEAISSFNAAKVAYENALIVCTPKDMPANWAMIQNNLGNVLKNIGARQSGEDAIASLNDAKEAYENALKVYTQKDMPVDWAMTQNNLGEVLRNMGPRQRGEDALASLEAAKAAYENALIVRNQKDMPADWAATQNNLGAVLSIIGARQSGEDAISSFNAAKTAYENALIVRTQKDMPADWAMTNENLAILRISIFEKNGDKSQLKLARQYAENAMQIYSQGGMEYYAQKCQNVINKINQLIE